MTNHKAALLDAIRAGDRVTIANRLGQMRTGRAVMRGPAGWVLNMGGKHGTPDIATEHNIVAAHAASARRIRELIEDEGWTPAEARTLAKEGF